MADDALRNKPLTLEEMQGLFGAKNVIADPKGFQVAIPDTKTKAGFDYAKGVLEFLEKQGVIQRDLNEVSFSHNKAAPETVNALKAQVGRSDIDTIAFTNDFLTRLARTVKDHDEMLHLNQSGTKAPNAQMISDALRNPKDGAKFPHNPLDPLPEPAPVVTAAPAQNQDLRPPAEIPQPVAAQPAPAPAAVPPAARKPDHRAMAKAPKNYKIDPAVFVAYMKGVTDKSVKNSMRVQHHLERNAGEMARILQATSLKDDPAHRDANGNFQLTPAEQLLAANGGARGAMTVLLNHHAEPKFDNLRNGQALGYEPLKNDIDAAARKIGGKFVKADEHNPKTKVANQDAIAKMFDPDLRDKHAASRTLAMKQDGQHDGTTLDSANLMLDRAQQRIDVVTAEKNKQTPSPPAAVKPETPPAAPPITTDIYRKGATTASRYQATLTG